MTNKVRWGLLVILLIAAMLRLSDLGAKSIWLDEAFSIWNSGRTPTEIWTLVHDNHPPLYYLLLHVWMALGDSEFLVRLPSVFISMLAVSLTYALGSRLVNKTTGLVAATLLALAPLSIWYAQEARMVNFVIPAALLIAYGLFVNSIIGGILLFLGLGIGLYLDYTIIPLWVMLSGIWFWKWWLEGRPIRSLAIWIIFSTAGWLLFMPLIPNLILVLNRMSDIFLIANLREALGVQSLGLITILIALLILAAGSALAAWMVKGISENQAAFRIFSIVVLFGFIVLTFLTPIPRLYSVKRVIVTGWPFIILVMAWIVTRFEGHKGRVLLGLALISLTASLVSLIAVPKDDWRGVIGYLNQHVEPDDIIWIDPFSGALPYNYYEPKQAAKFYPDLLPDPPNVVIWHIAERQPGRLQDASRAELWLEANRKLAEVQDFYRLEVRRYAPVD